MPLPFSQTCIASIILVTAAAAAASPPSAVAQRSGNWSDVSYYLPAPDGTRLAISWYFPSKFASVAGRARADALRPCYGSPLRAPMAARRLRRGGAGYARLDRLLRTAGR